MASSKALQGATAADFDAEDCFGCSFETITTLVTAPPSAFVVTA